MGQSEYHEASREQWSAAARSWARAAEEEETGASADATRWLLAAAELRPGMRVLELACGAARVGLQAASRVGPDGIVLCSDFSQEMIDAVAGRVERLGVPNVETRLLDAHQLDLGAEEFDAVLCRFGYMLMADAAQALRESGRVLRPDGKLALIVWGTAEQNPWLCLVISALIDHLNAPRPEPGAPGPFSLGEPERLRAVLAEAGLSGIEVEEIETEQAYDSLDAWWEELLEVSGPLAAMLKALPDEDREAIRGKALAGGEQFRGEDGRAVFPAAVLGATARR
ncbi:MAG TPA: methyltransferase domain-containing protein [Solirubrobacterales bacterium]|nr:methyltransferase domain-containing protein [Solirubrobacterales bacterium]